MVVRGGRRGWITKKHEKSFGNDENAFCFHYVSVYMTVCLSTFIELCILKWTVLLHVNYIPANETLFKILNIFILEIDLLSVLSSL
jgi:hypothetical protein